MYRKNTLLYIDAELAGHAHKLETADFVWESFL